MEHKPRPSIKEPREFLLKGGVAFVERASKIPGVERIALIGSIVTDKNIPKDIDFLVTVSESIDFKKLAKAGRQLQGYAHQINLNADIFIADTKGEYIGRICEYKEPWMRADCRGKICAHIRFIREGRTVPGQSDNALLHLCDDTEDLKLSKDLIKIPPLIVWPAVSRNSEVPDDVEKFLVEPCLSQIIGKT